LNFGKETTVLSQTVCSRCQTPVPAEIQNANFCTNCGRPLSQFCPYETQGLPADRFQEAARLALSDPSGRTTARCSRCGGLFKACDVCRRLYTLHQHACTTPHCTGTLREPLSAHPCNHGPLDGSRAISWIGGFDLAGIATAGAGRPESKLETEPLFALAYRYGMLLTISAQNLIAFSWSGTQWQPLHRVPLLPTGVLQPRSFMAANGYAYVVGEEQALAFPLIGPVGSPRERLGRFRSQICAGPYHILIEASNQLLIEPSDGGLTEVRALPPDVGSPTVMAAAGLFVYMATDKGCYFRLDLERFTLSEVGVREPSLRPIRMAVQGPYIIVLAFEQGPSSEMRLQLRNTETFETIRERKLEPGVVPDFAWTGNNVYLARQHGSQQSLLDTYNLLELTREPRSIPLAEGMETQQGMFAIDSPPGLRILLRRAVPQAQQFVLVEPERAAVQNVGPILKRTPGRGNSIDEWPADSALVCPADGRLVIASREGPQGEKTVIRTFQFT
jgi:hypothetical protein